MLKNRTIQIIGTTLLIVAAVLISISLFSVSGPATVNLDENLIIPVTGGKPSLAQYYTSERGLYAAPEQYGLEIYHQSERMQAENWSSSSDPIYVYHQSEWFGK